MIIFYYKQRNYVKFNLNGVLTVNLFDPIFSVFNLLISIVQAFKDSSHSNEEKMCEKEIVYLDDR